ncbi:HlyC/CorC family transporter [Gynuella sunshinyii]|uniref:Magnesium and cobalt efflux protein CorC n=1 Tax=Gynuella sunshinyii YC6258 TaxID=1445510 RepID=A0A0C5VKT2_9GAMM|nr:HlyC/CorC family transporter [Gynuella sunshinyii]AJQ95267.1 putative Mg2+ and Co2+ transporter CorB [Gynuella sunshinyii YC6258]
MEDLPIAVLFAALATLLLLSAFFSSSETGMMSLNRYRLKHLANKGHKGAKRARSLLDVPDRLIGVILIGNNLVNIAAAQLTTLIAIKLAPANQEVAIALGGILLTLAVLLFAEVTPKTLAQMHPERIAFPASHILIPLLKLLYPLVWCINQSVNILLWIFRIRKPEIAHDALTKDELKTLVNESGHQLSQERQNMLIGILDLENVRVNDIMVPRSEVAGIDLDDDIESIAEQLRQTDYTRLPIYKDDLDKVVGILHIRDAAEFLYADNPSKVMLSKKAQDPVFVPENTSLYNQLFNFQKDKVNIGLVVDEYGDIQGLVTLADILEEIVGEFTTDIPGDTKDIHPQRDGTYVIDGSTGIRDINKALDWSLPTIGPKTLNGLIIEQLEEIPEANVSIRVGDYSIEILQIKDNQVIAARVRKLK